MITLLCLLCIVVFCYYLFLALCAFVVGVVAYVYMCGFLVDWVRLCLNLCVSLYIFVSCLVFFILCFCTFIPGYVSSTPNEHIVRLRGEGESYTLVAHIFVKSFPFLCSFSWLRGYPFLIGFLSLIAWLLVCICRMCMTRRLSIL